jgi:hypothetical protein
MPCTAYFPGAHDEFADRDDHGRGRDSLGVTSAAHPPAMITLECAWCEAELTIDGLDATSVECPECSVSVEFAPDVPTVLPAAA